MTSTAPDPIIASTADTQPAEVPSTDFGQFMAESISNMPERGEPTPDDPFADDPSPTPTPTEPQRKSLLETDEKTEPEKRDAKPVEKSTTKPESKEDDLDLSRAPKTVREANKVFADYRKTKERLPEIEKERDAFKAELETLRKSGIPTPEERQELETLRGKLKSESERSAGYEKEVFAYRLEQSKEWREAISKPEAEAITLLDEIAAGNPKLLEGGAPALSNAMLGAITERDPAQRRARLNEVAALLPDADRVDFLAVAQRAREINQKAAALREQSKAAGDAISNSEKQKSEAQRAAEAREMEVAHKFVDDRLREEIPFLKPEAFKALPPEIQRSFNEAGQAAAGVDFGKLTPHEKAGVIRSALYLRPIVSVIAAELTGERALREAAEQKAAAAEKALAEARGSQPRIGDGDLPDAATDDRPLAERWASQISGR